MEFNTPKIRTRNELVSLLNGQDVYNVIGNMESKARKFIDSFNKTAFKIKKVEASVSGSSLSLIKVPTGITYGDLKESFDVATKRYGEAVEHMRHHTASEELVYGYLESSLEILEVLIPSQEYILYMVEFSELVKKHNPSLPIEIADKIHITKNLTLEEIKAFGLIKQHYPEPLKFFKKYKQTFQEVLDAIKELPIAAKK